MAAIKLTNRSKKNEAMATEQKILEAAREEFGDKGLGGARMQAIADKAGTNKALLHYYFRSKEKLFEAAIKDILSHLWTDIHRQLSDHREETDLRTLINAIVSAYITAFAAQPMLPRAIIREISAGSSIIYKIIHDFVSSHSVIPATIISIYNRELSKGAIKRFEVYHFMMNLMGMCAATFIVQPVAEYVTKEIGSAGIAFDHKFYAQRIKAITEMACDGIFIDKNVKPAKLDATL